MTTRLVPLVTLGCALALPVLTTILPADAAAQSADVRVMHMTPSTPGEERAIRSAIEMMARDAAHASHRWGETRDRRVRTGPGGNLAVVQQSGVNHGASVQQTGGNNAYGLVQYGCNTQVAMHQTGNQVALTRVFGACPDNGR